MRKMEEENRKLENEISFFKKVSKKTESHGRNIVFRALK